ncbi:MAG: transglycosylase SLT domain-containing protein [Pseudomonadales bacterium]
MTITLRWLPLLLLISFSNIAPANTGDTELHDNRSDYLRAKKLLRAGDIKGFNRIKKQLKGYALYPYLEYSDLSRNLARTDSRNVQAFLERYKSLGVAQRLRARWLKELGKQKRWASFIEYYDDTLADTQLRCYYLRAKLQTGKSAEVWSSVPSLWVVGSSQPNACDPLFESWVSKGYLKRNHKWERFRLAMAKSNISLANYLTGLMSGADQKAAKKFMRYHKNPSLVKKRGQLSPKSASDADIALHALRRLARSDWPFASRRLTELGTQFTFPLEALAETQKSIAFRILSDPQRVGLDWVREQLVDGVDADVAVYAARIALLFEHWETVLAAIDTMPESLQKTTRWQYWHAKASMQEDPKLDDVWRHNAFAELARKRDYYGFLSALLLQRSFDFNDRTVSFSPDFQSQISQIPGLNIALELYAAGELTSARREWRYALLDLPNTHMIAAAHIAQDWGWSSQAVLTTIMARSWDELSLRFPLSYREYMHRGARLAGIELSWAYAIARQESAMNPDAISHAGARGLMQLMPATAKATVKRNALPVSATNLLNEKDNSLIGSAHLGELSRNYNGNRILSSAAYNAGKSRANKWLKRSKQAQPFDVWVETIPFKETRNYVQNVLMFAAIYSYRLEENVEFIKTQEWIIKP